MTDHRHLPHRHLSRGQLPKHAAFLALAMAGVLLQGCDQPKPAAAPSVRVFAADMNGAAKTCETAKPSLSGGKVTDAAMKVGSDGGWCGITVANGGKPFDTSLMVTRPEHGKVFVHKVGNDTRVDYTPDFGFSGSDSFAVQLLPGDAGLRVAVAAVPH